MTKGEKAERLLFGDDLPKEHKETKEYIIATEAGILHELQRNCPDVKFYPVPPEVSEGGVCRPSRTTLLFLSTLKSARNFAFASRISCSLRSSNRRHSSAGKVSHVGVMILLVETSKLSFEQAIEGRSR